MIYLIFCKKKPCRGFRYHTAPEVVIAQYALTFGVEE